MGTIQMRHGKDNYMSDNRLSLKAIGLMSLILSLPKDWDFSVAGLATVVSDGESSIRSGIKELEKYNYLERVPTRKNGKITDWDYIVYAESVDENQQVENHSQSIYKPYNIYNINNNINKNKEPGNKFFGSINKVKAPKPKKKNLYTECIALIDNFTTDVKLRDLLIRYLKLRLEMRDKPMYKNQWAGLLNRLHGLSSSVATQREIVQYSMDRGYASFYEPPRHDTFGMNPPEVEHVDIFTESDCVNLERLNKERESNGLRTKF